MTPAFVYNKNFVNSMHKCQTLQNHFVESSGVKLLVSSAVNYCIYPCHNTNSSRYEQKASGQVLTYRVVTQSSKTIMRKRYRNILILIGYNTSPYYSQGCQPPSSRNLEIVLHACALLYYIYRIYVAGI